MGSIDDIIAGGAGASSRADFSGLGDIPKAYWEGKDQRAKNDLRDAFKGGIPLTSDGQPDVAAMAKTFFQKGDFTTGTALLGQAQDAAERSQYAGGSRPPIVSPPSGNRSAQAVVAPPLNKGGVQGQGQAPEQGGETPKSYLTKLGLQPGYNMEVGLAAFKRNGIEPDQPFDPNDPDLAKVMPAMQRMGSVGQVQPPQPGDGQQAPPPQQPPQMAQAPQPQVAQPPQMAQVPPQPQAPQAPPNFNDRFSASRPGNDPELNQARWNAGSRNKSVAEAGRAELKTILENRASTGPMKEAASQGLTLQQAQERQGEQAAQQAGASELAKAQVGEQQAVISQGRQAAVRLGTANLMTNIIQSDKNLDLGFGSATSLKIKMALERVGFDTGDLSGAQLLQKFNSILAAESTKGVTSRGTNFDMKTFMANNPGLGMDEKGNIRMLGILSQHAKREYELGKLVPKNRENWDNWDNVVEAYDKKNPIKDPTTGKILSNDSIIAPAPKQQGAQPQQAAAPAFANQKFANPDAARAAGAKKGDIVTDADGKQWRLR